MIVRESTKSKRMTILGTVAFMGENMHVQYVCMYVCMYTRAHYAT